VIWTCDLICDLPITAIRFQTARYIIIIIIIIVVVVVVVVVIIIIIDVDPRQIKSRGS